MHDSLLCKYLRQLILITCPCTVLAAQHYVCEFATAVAHAKSGLAAEYAREPLPIPAGVQQMEYICSHWQIGLLAW